MNNNITMSIDQSISKCAFVIWKNGAPHYWGVFKAGDESCKKKLDSVTYFKNEVDKIDFISNNLIEIVTEYQVSRIVIEGLALNAIGNATRTLAGLYYVFLSKLKELGYSEEDNVYVIPPTQVKSKARLLLENKGEIETVDSKGKVKITKVKMEKDVMIGIAEQNWPEVLKDYKKSGEHAGKEDLADALLIHNAYIQLKEGE